MTTPSATTDTLPVPYDALIKLGLTDEQIAEAVAARPAVVAFHADEHPDAWFDTKRAQRALRALGAFRHTKGRWAGQPLRLGTGLDPWQVVWVLAPVFGWVHHDLEADRVVRVIRSVWIEVPRKNGKSTLSSAVAAVLLLADGEMGAEVYAAAGSLPQAGRVFEDAKRMLQTSPHARRKIEPLKEVVRVPATGSILRVLSRDGDAAHGLNVSGAVIDEVHTLRLRRALVEAIETGTGARDQPLVIFITTADEAEDGTIYDAKHRYTRNQALGVGEVDPAHYGVIWAAEKADDPFAEPTWRKANPGYGKSPTAAYMRREAQKAKNDPTYFPTFCRLHLNLRMRDQSRWFDMTHWDDEACAAPVIRASLRGRRAWGGLDLSAVSDFTAWACWVEPTRPGAELELLTRFWLPREVAPELEQRLMVPIQAWAEQGLLTLTEGDVIDYGAIKAGVLADCRHLDMQRISYDRMFAGQMVQELDVDLKGVQVVPVAQTFQGLSTACKEMQRLVDGRHLRHGGHPILRWMAGNAEVKSDGLDNIRPVKPDRKKAVTRIDGVQAAVTGLDGWVRRERQPDHALVSWR